jgi:hypothetical protein
MRDSEPVNQLARLKRGECGALWIGLQRIHADDVRQLIGSQRHEALQLGT